MALTGCPLSLANLILLHIRQPHLTDPFPSIWDDPLSHHLGVALTLFCTDVIKLHTFPPYGSPTHCHPHMGIPSPQGAPGLSITEFPGSRYPGPLSRRGERPDAPEPPHQDHPHASGCVLTMMPAVQGLSSSRAQTRKVQASRMLMASRNQCRRPMYCSQKRKG